MRPKFEPHYLGRISDGLAEREPQFLRIGPALYPLTCHDLLRFPNDYSYIR